MNQTSMCVDAKGRPYIATYWTPDGTDVPQYFMVYFDGKGWLTSQVSKRRSPFSLIGSGTKKVPMSRPQIVIRDRGKKNGAYMIFRDSERCSRVSIAICDDLRRQEWRLEDLTTEALNFLGAHVRRRAVEPKKNAPHIRAEGPAGR